MAIPADCWRMVYRGTLPHGEVWQSGFFIQGNAPTTNASAQAAAQVEFDAEGGSSGSSLWHVLKSFVPTTVTLDLVAVYSYPAGGTVATHIGLSTGSALPGTDTATAVLPNQISMCASLLTGAAGRSYRGRMYLPVMTSGVLASGFWSTGATGSLATVLATKFTDINAAAGEGKVVVVSTKLTVATQVASVRIDTRPDVQRRRANRVGGVASSSSAVTP